MARANWQYALLLVLLVLAIDLVYQIHTHHWTIHPRKKPEPLRRVRLHPSKLPGWNPRNHSLHAFQRHPKIHLSESPASEHQTGAPVLHPSEATKAAMAKLARRQRRDKARKHPGRAIAKPHNYNPRLGKHYASPSTHPPPPPEFVHVEDEHLLTRELVAEVAVQNAVTVTWTNKYMIDFAVNWVHHARLAGINNILVGAMDGFTLAYLLEEEIPCFAMKGLGAAEWTERMEGDLGRHENFHAMGREKIHLIHTFVDMGFDVYLSDVDVVLTKDPFPYFAQYPDADMLTTGDIPGSTETSGALEHPESSLHAHLNIGLMFVRANDRSMAFVQEWQEHLQANPEEWDQNSFNMLVRRNTHTHEKTGDCLQKAPTPERREQCGTVLDSRAFSVNYGQAFFGILPTSLFCGGHEYFVAQWPQRQGLEVFSVHATFQFGGVPGKRHRFREAKLWVDPPAYYDHPGGYLTYEPNIPEALLRPFRAFQPGGTLTVENVTIVAAHMALVNYQLVQIRQAVGLALGLGRVLIVPPVWCGLDRWWAPHGGVIPGTHTQLPFQCPLDHVINLGRFSQHLEWREHSFLDNPRLPTRVVTGIGRVRVCSDDMAVADPCPEKEALIKGSEGVLKVPADDRYAKDQLHSLWPRGSDMLSHRVLKLDQLPRKTFTRFGVDDEEQQFQEWMGTGAVADIWCCVRPPGPGLPGEIWYDMWADRPVGSLDYSGHPRTRSWRMRTGKCKNKDAPSECFY